MNQDREMEEQALELAREAIEGLWIAAGLMGLVEGSARAVALHDILRDSLADLQVVSEECS